MLNLQKKAGSDSFNVEEEYVLKAKSINCLQITFKVHNDIVSGLKYYCKVKRLGFTHEDSEVLGSFAPTVEPHV